MTNKTVSGRVKCVEALELAVKVLDKKDKEIIKDIKALIYAIDNSIVYKLRNIKEES